MYIQHKINQLINLSTTNVTLSDKQKNLLSTNAQKWWNENYNADKNSIALVEQILAQ